MLGIGYLEIIVVLLVSFLVLKPEDMASSAKFLGRALAKLIRIINETKTEIEKKINND